MKLGLALSGTVKDSIFFVLIFIGHPVDGRGNVNDRSIFLNIIKEIVSKIKNVTMRGSKKAKILSM